MHTFRRGLAGADGIPTNAPRATDHAMTSASKHLPGRLELTLSESISTDLLDIRGVGPKTKRRLAERGIDDQLDLLLYIPRAYRKTYRFVPGPRIAEDRAEWVEAVGRVTGVTPQRGRRPLEVRVDVDGIDFKLLWFNLPYPGFARGFDPGVLVHFEGKVDHKRGAPSLAHPDAKTLSEPPQLSPEMELVPVYSSIENVNESTIDTAVQTACRRLAAKLEEGVPRRLLDEHGLPTIERALRTIHVLDPVDDLEAFDERLQLARNRLIYQEFFDLQTALTERYVAERRTGRAPECTERELGRKMVRRLPFELTGDQKEAIATIADELDSRVPMRRLLQGDVGSGKTVVALMAAAIAIANDLQVAMMAPTEILARQHLRRTGEYFDELDIDYAFVSGSQTKSERQRILEKTADGDIRLLIGTHALFYDDVEFDDLGLIIVDEEHKFGVEQRKSLLEMGGDPHLLSMTATPIPRSFAHAVFGDRDLTMIREKPPGRKPVRTAVRPGTRAEKVYDYVRDRIESTGEQAYVVYPLVEHSEDLPGRKNAVDGAEQLANGPFSDLRVGILHGRMAGEAKDEVMTRFVDGEIDVLCSTTVIEVGVDVPNATMMVVENAEVFGLSQLHQLRGRIGRGAAKSMCVLLTGYGLTDDARRRLHAMNDTDDGFELAEIDLRIRGPGEFLGSKQAGLPEFRFGDVIRDADWLLEARKDARRLLLGDASR